jgi:NADH:ubiquinone reductase (H+-translocating)
VVRPTLQTVTDDRIFAIGDCASCTLPGEARPCRRAPSRRTRWRSHVYRNLIAADGWPAARPDFVYSDHGSLVSLSPLRRGGQPDGQPDRRAHGGRGAAGADRLCRSLYRMHILAIHGWMRGVALILVGHVNQIVRPRLKLH